MHGRGTVTGDESRRTIRDQWNPGYLRGETTSGDEALPQAVRGRVENGCEQEQSIMTTNERNETRPANSPTPLHWTSPEIAKTYTEFFQARGHTFVPGSHLTAPGSGTSFIVAGMQQFLPYF